MHSVGLWSRIKKAVKNIGKALGTALNKIGNIHNRLGGSLWRGFLTIAKWLFVAIIVVTLIVTIPVGMVGLGFSGKIGLPIYGVYCGPGFGDTTYETPPIDQVDALCMKHEICYEHVGYFACDCDLELQYGLKQVIKTSDNPQEVGAATTILAWFSIQTPVTCGISMGIDVIRWGWGAIKRLFGFAFLYPTIELSN
jgi:hypothetical protein